MSYGFEVFDQVGALSSSSDRIGRIFGTTSHNHATTVSLYLPDFDPNKGFYFWTRVVGSNDQRDGVAPNISYNGSSVIVSPNGLSGVVVVGMNG